MKEHVILEYNMKLEDINKIMEDFVRHTNHDDEQIKTELLDRIFDHFHRQFSETIEKKCYYRVGPYQRDSLWFEKDDDAIHDQETYNHFK